MPGGPSAKFADSCGASVGYARLICLCVILMRSVTIAMTRYAEPDALLRDALTHAIMQQGVEGELLLVEQRVDDPFDSTTLPQGSLVFRMIKRRLPGLSAARNLALDEAKHDFVLFLDADALAAPNWAAAMVAALTEKEIAVVGSRIIPRWTGKEPMIARARVVRDQFSLLDLGLKRIAYSRAVGAGFGLDRSKTGTLRFDPTLGRRDGKLFSGEESAFCHLVTETGYGIAYEGSAVVEHVIAPERMKIGWVLKRLLYAGQSRARVGGTPSPSRSPGLVDWLTIPITLPPYAIGWLWGKLTRVLPKG